MKHSQGKVKAANNQSKAILQDIVAHKVIKVEIEKTTKEMQQVDEENEVNNISNNFHKVAREADLSPRALAISGKRNKNQEAQQAKRGLEDMIDLIDGGQWKEEVLQQSFPTEIVEHIKSEIHIEQLQIDRKKFTNKNLLSLFFLQMGAGRKTTTVTLKEKTRYMSTVNGSVSARNLRKTDLNGSVSARNLRKTDLGAVIFGCKHFTYKECLFKQLFDFVVIVGGFNGSSWLPSLDSYFPSHDHVETLSPMTFSRSHASVVKLNDELFVLGGNDVWFNAGTRIEMRFAPAAADINGAIYVGGGYDGKAYMKSVERFDPREHTWTTVGSMKARRGCHSLVAYNEKLYVLGGYDGENMVSSVMILDPRFGSWVMGEQMKSPRGYAGAVVLGGKIFVIGGVNDQEEILDTISDGGAVISRGGGGVDFSDKQRTTHHVEHNNFLFPFYSSKLTPANRCEVITTASISTLILEVISGLIVKQSEGRQPPRGEKSNLEDLMFKFIKDVEERFIHNDAAIANLTTQVSQLVSMMSENLLHYDSEYIKETPCENETTQEDEYLEREFAIR
ncbi:hypothetical protein RND71_030595 [Anisodus tanguticus]|uniref:Uncharacterized protein n=1 Tax=Anisodus tanguticus TaxID=243964 RepID=A0AAE1RI05_9SOLA|nr:hypothetical protein RND71_030595 [Anisodus tanguticus]